MVLGLPASDDHLDVLPLLLSFGVLWRHSCRVDVLCEQPSRTWNKVTRTNWRSALQEQHVSWRKPTLTGINLPTDYRHVLLSPSLKTTRYNFNSKKHGSVLSLVVVFFSELWRLKCRMSLNCLEIFLSQWKKRNKQPSGVIGQNDMPRGTTGSLMYVPTYYH